MTAGAEARGDASAHQRPRRSRARLLALFLGFAAIDLLLLRDALHGPFLSDDLGYVVHNPYVAALSMENLRAIFDPWSPAQVYAVGNYSPVHLLLHALERSAFGDRVLGYHVVNVLVHALAAVLLVVWLRSARVPLPEALLGGLWFAVHPAHVEAVAWISQLKTTAALSLSLGALLTLRRHPGWSTGLFGAALLTKAAAAFALPTAAALVWVWGGREPELARRRWGWVAAWAGLLALYAIPEFAIFARVGEVEVAAFDDPAVHARTVAAVGARYLVMAATSHGVAAFQEPEPARSLLDPWWLLALPAGLLLGWRLVVTLRRRRVEAVFWVAAAASFVPVSQLFPFLNPVADRYLYFILPGLVGGVLCAWLEWRPKVPVAGRRVLGGLAVVALLCFCVVSAGRARLWRSETLLLLDAAQHYPEGGTAAYLRARSAAGRGDVEAAMAELRRASDRGIDSFATLDGDPGLAPLRGHPEFDAFVRELAGRWIERAHRRGHDTPADLRMLALAHLRRDEFDEAVASYERAIAAGGPLEPGLRAELDSLRASRRPAAGSGADSGPGR
jgi:hypothetical protein